MSSGLGVSAPTWQVGSVSQAQEPCHPGPGLGVLAVTP